MKLDDVSTAIATKLAAIKTQNGSVPMDEITRLLENIVQSISPGGSPSELFLRDEITKIASHIQATKREILALSPSEDTNKHIGTAAIQLDAVVKATEEAAHTIMDAADEIQNVAAGADEALRQQITDITARIYEACNFQDLTGQRIRKVMQALDYTESRIQRLIGMFSSEGAIPPEAIEKAASAEEELLNGPQLPGHAPSQAEIDAMFGNLK